MTNTEDSAFVVLVADDNRDGAETLALALTLHGFRPVVAHDGVEAVAACQRYDPHVAILDLDMPRMDGFEACRQIKQNQPAIGLVALTGNCMEGSRERADQAGFALYLVKPACLEDVLQAIKTLTS